MAETIKKINVLVVGRVAWTKEQSTLNSIFNFYPAENLAYICIETHDPEFDQCANHFQISEIALIKKLFKWNIKTGRRRLPEVTTKEEISLEKKETSTLGWVRKHRSSLFLYIREFLWRLGGWKTKELNDFINDFNPDVLFFVSDPLPLVNRLQRYVLKQAAKPAAVFMMDDIWEYNSGFSMLRYMLRREVKKLIPMCKAHFAISEMMKREYDKMFGIDSVILTKGIPQIEEPDFMELHKPIKLLYTGKLIYGRDKSLAKVAKALSIINDGAEVKAELHIYTQTDITPQLESVLNCPGSCFIHKPIPYSEVLKVQKDSDIVLFVESLEQAQRHVARLSFSTKLTDYLASGKCIFAVGAADIAPIEYLRKHEAAQICTTYDEIHMKVQELIEHREKISMLARNAYLLGQEKHREDLMECRLQVMLDYVSNNKEEKD